MWFAQLIQRMQLQLRPKLPKSSEFEGLSDVFIMTLVDVQKHYFDRIVREIIEIFIIW